MSRMSDWLRNTDLSLPTIYNHENMGLCAIEKCSFATIIHFYEVEPSWSISEGGNHWHLPCAKCPEISQKKNKQKKT